MARAIKKVRVVAKAIGGGAEAEAAAEVARGRALAPTGAGVIRAGRSASTDLEKGSLAAKASTANLVAAARTRRMTLGAHRVRVHLVSPHVAEPAGDELAPLGGLAFQAARLCLDLGRF